MNIKVSDKNNKKYIEGIPGQKLIQEVNDAVDLLGKCYEHETNRILLYLENLPDLFTDLSSGEAGEILLKFSNYRVRAAFVLPSDKLKKGKFGEMVLESNRGTDIHFFCDREEAAEWLTKK